MKILSLSLVLVAHVCCLLESVNSNDGQKDDYSLRLMAETIKHLTTAIGKLEKRLRTVDKLEERLDEQDEVIRQLQMSLTGHDAKSEELTAAVREESRSAEQKSYYRGKRADDTASWELVLAQVTQRLNLAEANIQALKNSDQAKGTLYVRWGQSVCPGSAELVYSGYIGGSWYDDAGGATNFLCLPPDPTFGHHAVPKYGHAKLYGTEYQTCDEPECDLSASCAVCRISRESSMMLPARDTCYPGWTLEYSGYIMTNDPKFAGGMEYICVDSSHGFIPSSHADENGALLLYTTFVCGSLGCPPYIGDNIVLCAVCSK
ncbi:uncharacterized protein LOC112576074 [Pomacea canaliculata]|nr:uncharacterized protein LOC112576074 [Pomacea canaliculata]